MFGPAFVHERPAGGDFSLIGVDGKNVAVVQEWLFQAEDLPLPMQLLGLEGKPVPSCTPQNHQLGHGVYHGTAPIFITTPHDALAGLSTTPAEEPRGHAGMLPCRLKVCVYTVPVPKARAPRADPCPPCLPRLVRTAPNAP